MASPMLLGFDNDLYYIDTDFHVENHDTFYAVGMGGLVAKGYYEGIFKKGKPNPITFLYDCMCVVYKHNNSIRPPYQIYEFTKKRVLQER
jgi:hypothetical protein